MSRYFSSSWNTGRTCSPWVIPRGGTVSRPCHPTHVVVSLLSPRFTTQAALAARQRIERRPPRTRPRKKIATAPSEGLPPPREEETVVARSGDRATTVAANRPVAARGVRIGHPGLACYLAGDRRLLAAWPARFARADHAESLLGPARAWVR